MNEPFQLFVRKSKYEESRGAAAIVRNKYLNYLELTNIDGVMVQYTGLEPMGADIYTTALAGLNGATFQSSRLRTRNVVLTFTLLSRIEENRRRIFSMFTTGTMLRLFYADFGREAWIDGVVETVTANRFLATPHKQVIQVSMLCPDPLLKSMNEMEIELTSNSSEIYYGGEYAYGVYGYLTFNGSVTNPYIQIKPPFTNAGKLQVAGSFTSSNILTFSTIQGNRYAIKSTIGGSSEDVTNNIVYPIDWVEVTQGINAVTVGATGGASLVRGMLVLTEVYGGV